MLLVFPELQALGDGQRILIPADPRIESTLFLFPEDSDSPSFVWPMATECRRGEEILVHAVKGKTVVLQPRNLPPELQSGSVEYHLVPDFTVEPPWSPERIDAYLWKIKSGHRLEIGQGVRPVIVTGLPRVRYQVFARAGAPSISQVGAVAVIDDLDETVELDFARQRSIRIAGGLPPGLRESGGILVPGRPDVSTLQWLWNGVRGSEGTLLQRFTEAVPVDTVLPDSTNYSAYHPTSGVFRFAATPDGLVLSHEPRCSIVIRSSEGGHFRGEVHVWQRWHGTGHVLVGSSGEPMWSGDWTEEARIVGLPEGLYHVQVELESRLKPGAPGTRIRKTQSVQLQSASGPGLVLIDQR